MSMIAVDMAGYGTNVLLCKGVNNRQSHHMTGFGSWTGFNLILINHSLIPVPYNVSTTSFTGIQTYKPKKKCRFGLLRWGEGPDISASRHKSRICLLRSHACLFCSLDTEEKCGIRLL